ncbi:MAG: ABC transporter permease [Chloroflexia bacterium]|nr:ABC transporter permease [Chloroflexia bacterium]
MLRHPSMLPLAAFLVIAIPGRWLAAGDPEAQDLVGRLAPPVVLGGDWGRPLGSDGLGRDILSRIVAGAGLSLVIGVVAAIVSALIGIAAGLLAGILGGLVDTTVTLVSELALAIPTVVVGIVLTASLGQSLPNLLAVLIFTGWVSYARIVRLQSRQIVRSEFVEASFAIGARWPWVTLRHVIPNLRGIAIVLLFQQIAAVMLWEASLTYLGLGLPIERISLGGMIRDGQVQIFDAWWVSFFPGMVIVLAVVGFNLAADRIQAVLDPAMR